ncbi:hypothetical protein M91_00971, partial [Bos mutus]
GASFSSATEFILTGFSNFLQHLLPTSFLLYLLMYLFTLLGNQLIMATIWKELSLHTLTLHTPMYLFLCALSISEILYTFAVIPRMLADLLSTDHSIALRACASQMFFSFTFGFTHSFLLTVMGYDRYVAICHPLRYNVLMSPRGCACLVAWSWAGGSVIGLVVTVAIFQLTFYAASLSGQNYSTVSEFILIGFSNFPQQLLPTFFLLYLLMYLFTLLVILLIMGTIWREHSLHTPMYLFLCTLSISEILFTVAVTPQMLVDMVSTHRSITFVACASQMFFSFTFGYTHSFLLMIMGYDRYVAICHPLRYNVLMSTRDCA